MSTKRKILLLGGLLAAACCVIPSHGSERDELPKIAQTLGEQHAASPRVEPEPSPSPLPKPQASRPYKPSFRLASYRVERRRVKRERRRGASVAAAFPKLRTLLNRGEFSGKMKRRVDASGRKTQVATVAARRFTIFNLR